MTPKKCRKTYPRRWLDENYEGLLVCDGLDDAIVGVVRRYGMETITLYDRNKVIKILMERDDMTHDEAEEFFDFNIIGAWVGEKTPAFATFVNSH